MKITQRQLRQIIREELNESTMGGGPRRYMYGNNPREMSAVEFTSNMMQQMPDTRILRIVATPRSLLFLVNNEPVPTPRFFKDAFIEHKPFPEGPLHVYAYLARWCRQSGITHIMTDFLHEMGLNVGDKSVISMNEFYDLIELADIEYTFSR